MMRVARLGLREYEPDSAIQEDIPVRVPCKSCEWNTDFVTAIPSELTNAVFVTTRKMVDTL